MQMIEVSKLIPHPRNNEFFDDIESGKWEDFKASIRRRNVVEPITVTQELVIVSGHQRVRACKDLGILEIPCKITYYPDRDEQTGNPREDMILEDLISTNILQRGIGNINPMKMAKCILELERIYDIRRGSSNEKGVNQYVGDRDNLADQIGYNHPAKAKTQSDLADALSISEKQIQEYKKLLTLIPELQAMVQDQELNTTVAYKIWAKLNPEQQKDMFNQIGKEAISDLTQKATSELLKQLEQEKAKNQRLVEYNTELLAREYEMKQLEEKIEQLEEDSLNSPDVIILKQNYEYKVKEVETLNNQIKMLSEKKQEVVYINKEVEVDNTDYEAIDKLNSDLTKLKNDKSYYEKKTANLQEQLDLYKKDSQDYKDLKNQIDNLMKQKDDVGKQIESVISISTLVVEVERLLKNQLSPIKYSRVLIDMRDDETVINNVVSILDTVDMWSSELRQFLPTQQNYRIIKGDY